MSDEKKGSEYTIRRIPLGFFAVGQDGEDTDIAEIVIQQSRLVERILEEEK